MSQSYTGEVRNGVVVFESGEHPPDGAKVRVETVEINDESTPTLAERLRSVIGVASGLPSDFADQHDHYIRGTPKR
jgi:hypothetical protein